MKSLSPRPTCPADNGKDLVTLEHNDRISDPSLHYFGCLKVSERKAFFAQLPRKSQKKIDEECRRITRLRAFVESNPASKAGLILREFNQSAKEWYRHDRRLNADGRVYFAAEDRQPPTAEASAGAKMIFFKNGRPHSIPAFNDEFPNQMVSVEQLLSEDPDLNPLMQPCESGVIRYFHLPANNMVWVEVSPQALVVRRI